MTYNRDFTPERITTLAPNEVFVFGSNLSGAHGGGAALLAVRRFGAVWGQGVGMQGQSYAIPTMHGGPEAIKPYVDDFIVYAKAHPELVFLVTRIGCGIAGFSEEEIAPLFAEAVEVQHILLPEAFVSVLMG
jgi:O-acetyl-ADP-ribose deacetylase (regulator of RNase III)